MPKILVEKSFPFSPDGNQVVTVETGEQEVSDRCAAVAIDHLKVATKVALAPQNKAAAPKSRKG